MWPDVQSAAFEYPRWRACCAGGCKGLLFSREGYERQDAHCPGDLGPRFARDPGASSAAQGPLARRRGHTWWWAALRARTGAG
eukprot:2419501-Alexandrium_andersonii.AAC.1